uniref:Cytochrome P450 n=1 Tax=Salvator merianae TaxID=96440 RepID=A0A8D0DRF2_SALMN
MDPLAAAALSLFLCLCYLTLLFTWRQRHRKSKMPPGPTPLPFIGNLLQVNTSDMRHSFSKKYGPVYTIHLGPRRIVVLCGYDAVKEALADQAEDFSGRGEQHPPSLFFRFLGVAFSNGERTKQLRRFSLMTLRNFGLGRRPIEERILEEAHFLLEALRSTKGEAFDPTYMLSRTVSNVISSIIFGNRFDYEDPEFLSLLNMMLKTLRFTATSWGQVNSRHHFSSRCPQHEAFKHLLGLEEFVARKVKANQETLDPNSPRDFIDSFLVKMEQEKENPSSEFFLKNLVFTTLNIFFAGTETVSTTLRYAFLILLKYPEIEEKLHEEIDRVIGRHRSPNMDDRAQMPYTEAVIHEMQRYIDVLPNGLARRVIRDTQFRGYTIPKVQSLLLVPGISQPLSTFCGPLQPNTPPVWVGKRPK